MASKAVQKAFRKIEEAVGDLTPEETAALAGRIVSNWTTMSREEFKAFVDELDEPIKDEMENRFCLMAEAE